MKLDIKEIVSAWMISFNPSEEEQLLAEKRYEVCASCPNRVSKLGIEVCSACGCPLSKKIFTLKDQESCPLKKWDEVNQEFRKKKTSKYKLM